MVLAVVAPGAIGAAITLWKVRNSSPAASPAPAAKTASANPSADLNGGNARNTPGPAAAASLDKAPQKEGEHTGIFINENEITLQQVQELVRIYRYPAPRGRFWYDSRSGLYGVWGREAAGYIHPGHDFGALPASASTGDTGVFINGRELNTVEVNFLQILFNGQVQPGRAWLDGHTWNIGIEGSPYPIANLALAIQQQQQRSRGGNQWGWRDGSGATMASDGNCTMMAVQARRFTAAAGAS